MKMEVEMWLA